MWQLFALYNALGIGLISINNKLIMKKVNTSVYAFYFNLIGALMFLMFINEFSLPSEPIGWLYATIMAVLWALACYFGFEVFKHLDVSLISPVSNTTPVLILLLSVLLLNESFTIMKLGGVILVTIGAFIASMERKGSVKSSRKGLYLLALSLVLFSLAQVNDKIAINYFTPGFYGFLTYYLPCIALAPMALKSKGGLRMNKQAWMLTLITCLVGVTSYYSLLLAYDLTELSNISPVNQLSVIIAMIGGFIIFKEKNVLRKVLGALVIIPGVLLVI